MEAATAANAQSQRGDLGLPHARLLHIDSGSIGARPRLDPILGEHGDHRVFQGGDQVSHTQPGPAHINQGVEHHLARAVVGYLTTTVGLHNRDITRQ